MKNLLLIFILIFCSFISSQAQRSREYMLSVGSNYSGEALNVFDLRDKRGAEGSFYWNDSWYDGSIKLVSGKTIKDMPLKYDLLTNGLEIQVENDIKVLPGDIVEEFILKEVQANNEEQYYRFIRLDFFFDVDVIDRTFYELLQEGKTVSLLRKTKTEILEPNYVVILDAGSVNSKIIKKDKLMIFDGVNLQDFPKRKGKMLKILEKYKAGVTDYYKQNKKAFKGRDKISVYRELISFVNP